MSEDRDHSTSPPTPPGDEEEVPVTDIDSLQELGPSPARNGAQNVESKQQQDEVARLTIEVCIVCVCACACACACVCASPCMYMCVVSM